jgi:hypothetical protein
MLHGCIDDEGARRMAEGEEEDMDRSGILCTFFLEAGVCAFSFLRKSKTIVFCMVQKSRKGKKQKGCGGEEKQIAGLAPTPGPGLADRIGAVFFCTRMGGAGAFCVLYHGKGNKKRQDYWGCRRGGEGGLGDADRN